MTGTNLIPYGGEQPDKTIRFANRADQRTFARELVRASADNALAVRAEQGRVAVAVLHEQGRALIAQTAIQEVQSLGMLEAQLHAASPATAARVSAIVNAFTTGATMKLARW